MAAFINVISSTFLNKCPKCHQGRVFKFNNPFNFRNIFNMNSECSHCHNVYEKEPGYFTGAMYVAYALTSGWFIMWFILQMLILDWPTKEFTIFILITLVILAPLTFRWSRILWLNMFTPFDKSL